MSAGSPASGIEWLHAFMSLGCVHNNNWELQGGGVLLLDQPVAWLITATKVIEDLDGQDLVTWVRRKDSVNLLNISETQRKTELDWLHHPCGISATMFPVDPSFIIRAFSHPQCTKARDLLPMMPVVSLGSLMGPDIQRAPHDLPAVQGGIISTIDANSGLVHTTAPLLPRNAGAPLLLAPSHGTQATLAGILLGNTIVPEPDPRMVPIRLAHAVTIEAAFELIRSEAATKQRQRITESQPNQPENAGGNT
jgi:hypothetical protein